MLGEQNIGSVENVVKTQEEGVGEGWRRRRYGDVKGYIRKKKKKFNKKGREMID